MILVDKICKQSQCRVEKVCEPLDLITGWPSFGSNNLNQTFVDQWPRAPAGRKKEGLNSYAGLNYVRRCDWNLHRVHQAWLTTVVAAPGLTMRVHVNTRESMIVAKQHTSTQSALKLVPTAGRRNNMENTNKKKRNLNFTAALKKRRPWFSPAPGRTTWWFQKLSLLMKRM